MGPGGNAPLDAGAGGSGGTGGAVAGAGGTATGGAIGTGGGGGASTGGAGGTDGGGSPDGGIDAGADGAGGTGGRGAACGGLRGLTCPGDQWCDYPGDSCGAADQQGECKPKEPLGPACGQAVCGCNGKAYPSDCRAHRVNVDTVSNRSCIPGNGGAGAPCGADADCRAGFRCCESGGSLNSSLVCRELPAGTACPLVP